MKHFQTNTIVFITGAFLSNSIWDDWRLYFERNGYITIAPSWPYKDATTEELKRRHPDSMIGSVGLSQLIKHYADMLSELPEKTILIGHSTGGLLTQLLVQLDVAVAGIAIHSYPPQGIKTLELSFYRSLLSTPGLFSSAKKTFLMSFSQWQYAVTNGMPHELQYAAYQQFLVPESIKILREGLLGFAKVDFHRMHVPLLFISGTEDHLTPASLNYANYKRYQHQGSVTAYKEFKGKCHFVLAQPSWQEEAEFILQWISML